MKIDRYDLIGPVGFGFLINSLHIGLWDGLKFCFGVVLVDIYLSKKRGT